MADVYGGFDFLGAGNALSQMQSGIQARQSNALQMQYTMEDRAREAENRKIAAGNARAEQARKQQFIRTIQSGYMPAKTAVMGPGTIQGNAPASFDPEKVKNELLRLGDLSGLVTFSNAQEQFAKQTEQEAKAAGQSLINEETQQKTKLTAAQTDKEQAEITAKYIDIHANQINFAPNYETLIALTKASYTPGHPMAAWLAKNGVSQEDAVAELIRRRDADIPFEETRALMARGATNAAKDAAELATSEATATSTLATAAQTVAQTDAAEEKRTAPVPTSIDAGGKTLIYDSNSQSPTYLQILKNVDKTLTPVEAVTKINEAEKLAWERANPEFTLQETAQGLVAVNKRNPNNVTPVQLGGQTLMPKVTPVPPTELQQLQDLKTKLSNANPNDPRINEVEKAIVKLTTQPPGQTINIGEKGSENTIKKGGEITLANYQALKTVPRSIASLETVKKLILMPGTKDMLGGGASVLVDVANTLNNRLGTNINVKGLTNAVEIRSRLFEGVVARLKQMDSQPSERQQAALAEALGNIDTDPDALARVVDVWIEEMKDKVKTHNALIAKQVKSGDTAIGDYTIDLPEADAAAPTVINWK